MQQAQPNDEEFVQPVLTSNDFRYHDLLVYTQDGSLDVPRTKKEHEIQAYFAEVKKQINAPRPWVPKAKPLTGHVRRLIRRMEAML